MQAIKKTKKKTNVKGKLRSKAAEPAFEPWVSTTVARLLDNPCSSGRYMLVCAVEDIKSAKRQLRLYICTHQELLNSKGIQQVTFDSANHQLILASKRIEGTEDDWHELRVLRLQDKNKPDVTMQAK